MHLYKYYPRKEKLYIAEHAGILSSQKTNYPQATLVGTAERDSKWFAPEC